MNTLILLALFALVGAVYAGDGPEVTVVETYMLGSVMRNTMSDGSIVWVAADAATTTIFADNGFVLITCNANGITQMYLNNHTEPIWCAPVKKGPNQIGLYNLGLIYLFVYDDNSVTWEVSPDAVDVALMPLPSSNGALLSCLNPNNPHTIFVPDTQRDPVTCNGAETGSNSGDSGSNSGDSGSGNEVTTTFDMNWFTTAPTTTFDMNWFTTAPTTTFDMNWFTTTTFDMMWLINATTAPTTAPLLICGQTYEWFINERYHGKFPIFIGVDAINKVFNLDPTAPYLPYNVGTKIFWVPNGDYWNNNWISLTDLEYASTAAPSVGAAEATGSVAIVAAVCGVCALVCIVGFVVLRQKKMRSLSRVSDSSSSLLSTSSKTRKVLVKSAWSQNVEV